MRGCGKTNADRKVSLSANRPFAKTEKSPIPVQGLCYCDNDRPKGSLGLPHKRTDGRKNDACV
ncbi:hypothetical protein GCM10023213_44060 [Prosthecobacter algae]|uniref:Uncharacterized protein n=1 Tax=Prosthecobacter algae TaxID=1144682 RepID=A0ABP9PL37_9BACT